MLALVLSRSISSCKAHFAAAGLHFAFIAIAAAAVILGSVLNADAQSDGYEKRSVSRSQILRQLSADEPSGTAAINVTAPTLFKSKPSTFSIPITVDNISGLGVFAFQFNVLYNPAVIDPSGVNFGCSTAGTLAGDAGLTPTCNILPDGTLRVSVSGVAPMTGSGTVMNLTFATDAAAVLGSTSPLTFENVFFFNSGGALANVPHNGQVTVIGPTAAGVSLGGRVLTADGRGVQNARIVVTGGALSEPRYAVTGTFGYYNFEDLPAGQTYVVTINSKRFTFASPSRVVNVTDNVADIDFIADILQ